MNTSLARENISEFMQSGIQLGRFYAFMANNPHLTFWQSAQIFSIRPDVRLCKSFDDWHTENNRRIRKGSKGIPYYDERDPFRRKYVFDVSQTYGEQSPAPRKKRIPEKQLFRFVENLNVMRSGETDPAKGIKAALETYCREHTNESGDAVKDEEYIACLSEGITQYLYEYTGNERESDVGALPFDYRTNFAICTEVVTLANGIIAEVENQIRRIENERQERERIKAQTAERKTTETNTGTYYQQTLFDFATGISNGKTADLLFATPDGRTARRTPDERADRSGNVARLDFYATDETERQLRELYGKREAFAVVREDGGGNRVESSGLPRPRNYRLTAEIFVCETGAKTRYKNNVAAIKLLYELKAQNRPATDDEKAVLARYVGWGGLAQAFDSDNLSWQNEYAELKELLNGDAYRNAKESVLTSYYTDKSVIDAVFTGLKRMGLTNGKILEPAMGVGNFIGLLPDTFRNSETYGVEIDSISGEIAKLLYPETHVEVKGFERTNYANESFDAVVTNVPFGSYKVYDRDYDKFGFYVHNYFIAKSLDKVRAGGIVAVITTKGTMDKQGKDVRQYIADRAELLGAIRLPNNAFKTSANTEVTSDILFFKKRDRVIEATDEWIHTSGYPVKAETDGLPDGYLLKEIPLNSYFVDHPDMMLGTMAQHKSMYGRDDETELMPDGRELSEALAEAVAKLPQNVYDSKKAVKSGEAVALATLPAENSDVKNYCFAFIGSQLYQRINDSFVAQYLPRTNIARMQGLIEIRTQIRRVLDVQIKNCTDEELNAEQRKLNALYDRFVKNYGIVNSRTNRGVFREDADYALLISIENVNEATGEATKTDVFSKRTIKPYEKVTSCDTAQEALQVCKNEQGIVDISYIEQLTGKGYEEVIDELGQAVYQSPLHAINGEYSPYEGWELASEYLSGNVKEKLKAAEIAAKDNPTFKRNVDALKAVQPKPLGASEISVRLGASWVEPEDYHRFICELLNVNGNSRNYVQIAYEKFSGAWLVQRNFSLTYGMNADSVYGTKRMDAYKIFEHCLNLQTPSVYDTIKDGDAERRVLNKAETIAVREKQRKIQEAFKEWVFDDQKRRERLVKKYNDLFNNTVLPQYDGSYLRFPSMNPLITLKDYQKDAVDRIISSGNTLLHHVVGAGKTFEIAAACMKMRQLGIAKKPMIVVPNHLVIQWANEFRTLYPNANILIATKKDFEMTNRKRFVARVATGDWDAVVIASSSFEKIPISRERQSRKVTEEIAAVEISLEQAKVNRDDRITVKNLQRVLKGKKAILEKLTDDSKKDDLLIFEDLGVDYLMIDEAHRYKNKFIFTKMNNIAGISQAMSQRASDMDIKCEYVNELHGGNRGVVFATGTPISNSMVEMFTMQSYLQRDELERKGMRYFDAWAANFGETQTALELAPSGQGYRTRTRFAKFTNLPELLKMYRAFADVKTADMLNLPTPKANKIIVKAEPSDEILALNDEIVKRAEKIAGGGVKPEEDNMLVITHDGKKIALDPRCFDPTLPDNPMNKVNLCVENLYRIWDKTAARRSTQVVFCDLSTPKRAFADYDPEKNFDVYNDIKFKLVKMGIPAEEIAYIHEANTDNQKQELFDKVRRGDIRILIGSTEKCGAGTNIQNKLVALHHLDTPYRPSDLEQREGRIVRQGNENESVGIYTYVTERTFDSYSYQILENKQRFISQINRGDLSVREAADIDEATLTFSEIKAITAANPKVKRKMEIEQEMSRLRSLKGSYLQSRYHYQNRVSSIPQEIKEMEERLAGLQNDIALRNDNKVNPIRIGNKAYAERKDAGEALCALVKSQKYVDQKIGTIFGFHIIPCAYESFFRVQAVKLVGIRTYTVDISDDPVGTVRRLENALNSLENNVNDAQKKISGLQEELQTAKTQVEIPFEHEETFNSLGEELAAIDVELDLGKEETPVVLENETEKENVSNAPFILPEQRTAEIYAS